MNRTRRYARKRYRTVAVAAQVAVVDAAVVKLAAADRPVAEAAAPAMAVVTHHAAILARRPARAMPPPRAIPIAVRQQPATPTAHAPHSLPLTAMATVSHSGRRPTAIARRPIMPVRLLRVRIRMVHGVIRVRNEESQLCNHFQHALLQVRQSPLPAGEGQGEGDQFKPRMLETQVLGNYAVVLRP